MALVLADRVRETTTTTGTGAVTLAGAATGCQAFSSAIGNGNTTYYTIADQGGPNWEVGMGTYSSSGNTLARTTVLASSNAGSLVTFTAGTKDVFVTYPAEVALYSGGALGTPSSGTLTNCTFPNASTSVFGAVKVDGTTITASSGVISAVGGGGSGTVTSVSVVSANGFTGTVATATTTPDITLTTSITGILKGNGTAISAAVAGDFPTLNQNTTGTAANVTETVAIANGGTGATTLAGAKLPVWDVANTFTGTQTFSGTSTTLAAIFANAAEKTTVSATAATGTIAYYTATQSVMYYTTNASANWTLNLRHSAGTTLNTAMAIGQTVTVTFMVTQGTTAFYNNTIQVDGTTVTPKWQGGTAPTSGNASAIDVYTFAIVKTAAATFTVLASVSKFA